MSNTIRTIDREELHSKINRGDAFKLVMCLSDWAFRQKRIPGSIRFETTEEMLAALTPSEEVVVYCSNLTCPRSQLAYHALDAHGFKAVRRYAAGLEDWESAGLPLEGTAVRPPAS